MSWSWRVGKLCGIDVYVHLTFFVFLAWIAGAHWLATGLWEDAFLELAFVVVLFGVVLLHELGHALAARRFRIKTKDITLLPIGGVARLERIPEQPLQELVIALAGPAVNVALAVGLFLGLSLSETVLANGLSVTEGPFLERLLAANLWLIAFNLLPAFPMDGGRVLRALLALCTSYPRATQIAAGIGQGLALTLGFWGLFTNPMLILVALFVWIGAAQEADDVVRRSVLAGLRVRDAMVTDVRTLDPDDLLETALHHARSSFQEDFPVIAERRPVGVLTRNALLFCISRKGPRAPVRAAMETSVETADPDAPLIESLSRLGRKPSRLIMVVQGERLLGLVTLESVSECVIWLAALRRSHVAEGQGET